MLIGKEFKALSHLADTKTGKRPVLEGIHFTPDFAESADGFILLQVPYSKEFKEEDYPPTPQAGNNTVDAIIPATAITAAIKRIVKLKHLPITEHVRLTQTDDHVILTNFNFEDTIETPVTPTEGTYPDTARLIPRLRHNGDKNVKVFTLSPDLLLKIAHAAKDLNSNMVHFQVTKPQSPIRYEIPTDYDNERMAVGAVMPMFSTRMKTKERQ